MRRVRAFGHRGEVVPRQTSRLIWSEGPDLAEDHPAGAAILIAVLDNECARTAGFQPNPEAAQLVIPAEDVPTALVRLQAINNALRDLGHSNPRKSSDLF